MIRSLRTKIFVSLSLLILMLLAAGIMSILEFKKMGDSADILLKNNYQSIESAKRMIDAIEREESGVLLWMTGDIATGISTIHRSDSLFREALSESENNITETEEPRYITSIRNSYDQYHTSVVKIISSDVNEEAGKTRYNSETQALFFKVKKTINDLMVLNQDQMYRQSGIVKEKSRRAMMPAIVSIAAAVIFALLLNFFITIYFIHPIQKLINGIKDYYPEQGRLDAGVVSKDEFKTLEDEINNLINRLLRKRDRS